jgi:hypothetical protein
MAKLFFAVAALAALYGAVLIVTSKQNNEQMLRDLERCYRHGVDTPEAKSCANAATYASMKRDAALRPWWGDWEDAWRKHVKQ